MNGVSPWDVAAIVGYGAVVGTICFFYGWWWRGKQDPRSNGRRRG